MRKIYFLFLFVLIASMSGLQAAEKVTTFDFVALNSEYSGSSNITVDDVTFIGGGTGTPSRCWSDGLRIYKGGTITFTVPEGYLITKIEFSSFINEWNGSQQSVLFDNLGNNSRVEIETVTVTYETPNVLMAPEIEGVVSGETYYGSASVNISYPDLATSMTYTITKDGAQYKQETGTVAVEGLELNEVGVYKVEASATDGSQTLSAEAVEFTIVDGAEYTVTGAETDETSITTEGAEGTWTLSKSLTYGGKDSANRGWQIGSKGSPMGEFTLTLDKEYENIVSVIVNAATGGSCTLSVTVGGNAFGEEVSLTEESADYEFTGNASGNVTLNFNASEKACYLKSIIIITSGNDTPVTKCAAPEFSLAEGTYNETQTLTITSTEGSTIVYSINDGEIEEAASPATITLEAEATAVTYEIVAFATMDGAEESETVTKTYTIDSTAQIEDMDFATIVSEGGHKYGNGTSCYEFISGDVTVTSTKGSTDSRFWENKDVFTYRFYGGATLTVSVPAKYALTKIEFVADEGLTSMTTETGNYSAESVAKAVWMATDEVSSVTFSTTKTVILEDMIVYYKSIPAGVEGVEAADAAIRANADGVVVVAADAVAEVYNAAGQLVATAAVDGESVIAVPAGFYVVRVGNTIAKVVVR